MNDTVKTVHVDALSKVVTPLTHNSGTSGNETIVSTEPVVFNGQVVKVPIISGNSIRHRCIREPGSDYIVSATGLYGKCSIDILNYLYNGGSLTKSATNENMKIIAAMQSLLPLIRLLGGSLPSQIVNGSLIVKRAILICLENLDQLQHHVPESHQCDTSKLMSCHDFIGSYQYTRGDARRNENAKRSLDKEVEVGSDSNLMIYSGQTIIPGALFWHGFVLQNVSILEFGALVHALESWASCSGSLGGASRIGHGQVETYINVRDCQWSPQEAVAAYIDHVEKHKDDIFGFLMDNFGNKKLEKEIKDD